MGINGLGKSELRKVLLSVQKRVCTQIVATDTIIIAIGQAPDTSFLSKDSQIERSLWGRLGIDQNRLSTNVVGIFAGGDFKSGPSTVIEAIASGRRAAMAIDQYLQGDQGRVEIHDKKTSMHDNAGLALDEKIQEDQLRIRNELVSPKERIKDFCEVEIGYVKETQAHEEAMRCLRCDLEKERR